ncbi:MAG: oligosaccharide flippase family protein [Planctomycetota bacterium]
MHPPTEATKSAEPGASAPADSGGIREAAVFSMRMSLVGQVAGRLIQLGSSMILSRILFPEAYGLMRIVMFVAVGLAMLSDAGVHPALVRHPRGEEEDFLSTGWTISIIRGALLWLVGMALAGPVARFYGAPELEALLLVSSSVAFITGLQSINLALLQRRLQLGRQVAIELGAQVFAFCVTLTLALTLQSAWALVLGYMSYQSMLTVLSHVAIPGPRARLRLDREAFREIYTFGRWVFLSTVVTFGATRFDEFLLPKLIPAATFGVYSLALLLIEVPRNVNLQLTQTVLFPALSAFSRRNHESLVAAFDRVWRILLPTTLLVALGTAAAAPLFFAVAYDDRYLGAGWMTQLLMLMLWFDLVQTILGRVVLALDNPRFLVVANAVRFAAAAAGCIGGHWLAGFPGFILGYGLGPACATLLLAVVLTRDGLPVGRGLWLGLLIGGGCGGVFAAIPYLVAAASGPEGGEAGPHALTSAWITAVVGLAILGPWGMITARRVLQQFRAA